MNNEIANKIFNAEDINRLNKYLKTNSIYKMKKIDISLYDSLRKKIFKYNKEHGLTCPDQKVTWAAVMENYGYSDDYFSKPNAIKITNKLQAYLDEHGTFEGMASIDMQLYSSVKSAARVNGITSSEVYKRLGFEPPKNDNLSEKELLSSLENYSDCNGELHLPPKIMAKLKERAKVYKLSVFDYLLQNSRYYISGTVSRSENYYQRIYEDLHGMYNPGADVSDLPKENPVLYHRIKHFSECNRKQFPTAKSVIEQMGFSGAFAFDGVSHQAMTIDEIKDMLSMKYEYGISLPKGLNAKLNKEIFKLSVSMGTSTSEVYKGLGFPNLGVKTNNKLTKIRENIDYQTYLQLKEQYIEKKLREAEEKGLLYPTDEKGTVLSDVVIYL